MPGSVIQEASDIHMDLHEAIRACLLYQPLWIDIENELLTGFTIAITGYMYSETETSVVFLDGQDCESSDRQSGVNAEFLRHFSLSSGEQIFSIQTQIEI